MTDKKIIIDGVDVITCSERGETISGITCGNGSKIRLADRYIYKYKLCKDNPNCLFKQLARKTQEVEKLKKQLTSLSYADTICALEIDLKHKTQECEQAEQKLKRIEEYCKEQNLKADYTACEILQIIDEVE